MSAQYMIDEKNNQLEQANADEPAAIGTPEPWAGWETRLCLWSLALGIGGLLLLAALVPSFSA